MITLETKLLDSEQFLPHRAYNNDAGADLCTTIDFELAPFERKTIPCGFSCAIPDSCAGLVIPRSGLASRHGITVVNAPGLIDAGYRGEIAVVLMNLDPHETFQAHRGDRIAQLVIIELPSIEFQIVDSLPPSQRDGAGFGSSGR